MGTQWNLTHARKTAHSVSDLQETVADGLIVPSRLCHGPAAGVPFRADVVYLDGQQVAGLNTTDEDRTGLLAADKGPLHVAGIADDRLAAVDGLDDEGFAVIDIDGRMANGVAVLAGDEVLPGEAEGHVPSSLRNS
jgi:hypothetical protein